MTDEEQKALSAALALDLYNCRNELDDLKDAEQRRDRWLEDKKEEAGYDRNVSFDVVWKEVLEKAKQAQVLGEPLIFTPGPPPPNNLAQYLVVRHNGISLVSYNPSDASWYTVEAPGDPTQKIFGTILCHKRIYIRP